MIKHITRLFSLIALFAISNVAQAQTSCSGVEVVHFMETIINAHSGVQNSQNNLGPADGESAYFPGQISMSWELGEWLPAGTEIWVRYKNDCDSAHFIQAGFPCWQEANGNWAVMTDTYNIKSTTYVWDKIILTDSANKFAYEHRGTCDIYIDCFKWYTCETGVNTIEGHYFGDLSNFGTFDASEPRIIGEKIYLFLDANGNGVLDASEMTPIDSTETDIEGYYQLHDEYTGGTVKYIVQPATLIASGIYSTDTSHLVTFTSANNESTDNDFGVRESVTITGSVFKDVNINGIYNTGENPESGIDVYLYLDANNNGVLDASETTVVATQTTGADGTYTFTEVYGGGTQSYIIKTDTNDYPTGYILIKDNTETATFTSGGSTDGSNDFGYNLINKITGTVFLDTDVDSLFDSGESGLSGVTVYLFEDTNNNGIIDASETTAVKSVTVNSDGTYNFDVIYTGGTNSYIVGTNESSYPAVYDLTTDNVEVASFTSSGNTDDNNDFGANSFNVITGMVFLDADVDANNDAGESGQESVVVYVYNDANNNGIVDASESTPVAIDTTDANGQYEIKVPYIGGTENYIISTNTSTHPDASSLTTDNTETATFTSSGNTDANNDYGYGLSLDNIIKGTVYEDLNGNGTFDSGESGQSGITVYLYKDANGNGTLAGNERVPVDAVTTGSDGSYTFNVEYSGSTDNFIIDTDLDDYPTLSSLTTDNSEGATFTSGGNEDLNNDFGFNLENAISGTVFLDADLDGSMDVADVGTSNILVLLYEDTDADGTVSSGDVFVDSIRTDANGDYEFLAPYNGGTDRFVLEIDTTTIGGNIVMTTDNKEVSVFTSGGNADINNDFGYNLINKITGTIFLDDDVDGVLDAGENGLSGVAVYLFEDANDNGILDASETTSIQSTTVGSDGTYSFEENYSGGTDSYIVSTSESSYPANYDLTTDNIEVASFTTGGNTDENNDFGANSFNTITGMVFLDADVDTINDAAEVGVEDVTIYLYEDTNGNGIVDASESTPIAVDTTDANGAYIFKVPYNGGTENYLMSAESAAFPTSTLLTTDNTESATFASSGNTDPNNDFGLSSGNRITGTVFSDVNGDGDIDAGDAGVAGVTIYLYNDADGDGVINGAESAPIDSTTTASDGTYIFHVDYSGSTDNFIVDTDLGDYPSLSSLTTDNIESATFTTGGNVDPNNDFGFNLGNSISGTVFLDKDLDGFMDSDDDGTGNILVVLYEDLDGDGDITAGDIFIDSTRTDANGDYEFLAPYDGGTDRFVLEIDTNTIGGNKTLTTDNLEVAVFASGGNTDPNNNFGYNCTLNSGISGPTTSCAESDEIFSVDPAVSGATNTWSFTGDYTTSSLPTEESQTLSWDNKGVYTVKLVVEYKGCIDSFEQTININDAVQAIADDADTVCRNGAITLDGSNSTSGVDFNWSVVSGDIFSIDVGATTSQPTVSPLITTIYKMTVTNPTNGCSTIDYTTVNVNVQKNPSASLQVPSTVVDSTTIKLDGSGSTAPVDNPTATLMYGWFKDGVQLDVTFDDTLQTNILGDADYSLVVVDITNSCTDTAVVRIEPISNPLPVELIEFTATLVDDEDVEVKWTTASELNNHYFIVQRRFEHEAEFTNVSEKIDGKGTSSSKNSYTFTDTENTWLNTVAYYRLVQYDLDGTFEIHKEEAVRNSQQKISVSVFPNPARTSTCVKVNNNKVSSIQLYDAYGSPVGDERIIRMESNIYEINLNGLSKGNYILKVISNNQVVTSKVIVL